jgi:RHS repeat-associated protein
MNSPNLLNIKIKHSPFGSIIPGRCFSTGDDSYGFQGQEKENDVVGEGLAYKYRIHDARVGRFLSVDPLSDTYPFNSPYAFSENRVLDGIELEGREYKATKDKESNYNGFTWDPDNAYDNKGNLKTDYYEKAILIQPTSKEFSQGTWNESKQRYDSYNIGTAKATVYSYTETIDEEGNVLKTPSSKDYNFTSLPSDPNHFNTLASGLYVAKYGRHPISDGYRALNVYSIDGSRTLPAVGGGTISGVNIHKTGDGNFTGTLWSTSTYTFNLATGPTKLKLARQTNPNYGGISEGCPTCSKSQWGSFIGSFGSADKNIGFILKQRSFSGSPTILPSINPDVQLYEHYKKAEFSNWKRNNLKFNQE